MFSYFIHYIVFQSYNSKVVINNSEKYFDATDIGSALIQFWDYVKPITENYYVVISYMAKEIHPDTYHNPKFKFEGGKINV